jgi:hypothetical protein
MIEFATFDERPDLAQRHAREAEDIWPPHMQFVYHDEVWYVVRGALSPLTIDRELDQGILIEPNVWMIHRL